MIEQIFQFLRGGNKSDSNTSIKINHIIGSLDLSFDNGKRSGFEITITPFSGFLPGWQLPLLLPGN
jgi:hypothetical protein